MVGKGEEGEEAAFICPRPLFGQVDDWYASFEWSEGGIIHAHMAFWVVGAPRVDKIEAPRESALGSAGVEVEVPLPGQHAVPQAQAVDRLAAFWDRAYTEYNVAKAMCPAPSDGPPDAARRSPSCQPFGARLCQPRLGRRSRGAPGTRASA